MLAIGANRVLLHRVLLIFSEIRKQPPIVREEGEAGKPSAPIDKKTPPGMPAALYRLLTDGESRANEINGSVCLPHPKGCTLKCGAGF